MIPMGHALTANAPSPLCGGGWPLREQGSVGTKSRREGSPASGMGTAFMQGRTTSCTVAPLSPPASQGTLPRSGGRESFGEGALP